MSEISKLIPREEILRLIGNKKEANKIYNEIRKQCKELGDLTFKTIVNFIKLRLTQCNKNCKFLKEYLAKDKLPPCIVAYMLFSCIMKFMEEPLIDFANRFKKEGYEGAVTFAMHSYLMFRLKNIAYYHDVYMISEIGSNESMYKTFNTGDKILIYVTDSFEKIKKIREGDIIDHLSFNLLEAYEGKHHHIVHRVKKIDYKNETIETIDEHGNQDTIHFGQVIGIVVAKISKDGKITVFRPDLMPYKI